MQKGVEGIRIRCSSQLKGAKIARTECEKYGKTSRNVFHQKIDYAPAEVSTCYGISGVKVQISYSKKKSVTRYEIWSILKADVVGFNLFFYLVSDDSIVFL